MQYLQLASNVFETSAGGRNRTDMVLLPADFESAASTSFTTPAISYIKVHQSNRRSSDSSS